MRFIVWMIAILTTLTASAHAERLPILLDGAFDDWLGVQPVYTDPTGDGGPIDFGRLWAADDPRSLFLRFEAGTDILLNEGNNIVVYLDTDANSQTGLSVGGIGAELEWHFGNRSGTYRYGGQSTTVRHPNLKFVALPTVTGSSFEMIFGRDARPDGSHLLFPGPVIRILFWNGSGGDHLPDDGQMLNYTFDQGALPQETLIPLSMEQPGDLRITTNNIHNDGLWDGTKGPAFGREYAALAPKILNFQEIYNHSAQQTAQLVESWLPSGPGESWHGVSNNDCHTVSRYPVVQSWPVDGNLAVLLNTIPAIGSQLLIINVHLPCCTDDAGRQREIDHILSFIRDAKEPGGTLTLAEGTPILILGDMNLVGLSQQLTSLLTGDIIDNQTYGPDFSPDWDGGLLADLVSRQTERRLAYTYRNDSSDYWPGRLDLMIATDSVLRTARHLVLYTPEMSADSLSSHGLQATDSTVSDHIILCADFRPAAPSESTGAGDTSETLRCRITPNPSVVGAQLRVDLPRDGSIFAEVWDAGGRRIALPLGPDWIRKEAGSWILPLDGSTDGRRPAPGIYLVRLMVRDGNGMTGQTLKWTLLR
jgi:hypothetical protein